MFYRYEAKRPVDNTWVGICKAMTPSIRHKMAGFLTNPKWYHNHPDVDTRCWFTQYGYDRYHSRVEKLIEECMNYYPLKVRLLKEDNPGIILMKGKVQCICSCNIQQTVRGKGKKEK